MKKIIASVAALGFAAALSPAAFAQGSSPLDFATVDADASGGISWAEFQVALPDIEEARFMAADIDGNGELSEEEYATFAAEQNYDLTNEPTSTGESSNGGESNSN